MSADKPDISQIRKYLNGELDAKAMHRLEREAQDDPFLMDALEGYGLLDNDQQDNLAELQQRIADRVAPKKERSSILFWRVLPVAAALLVAISIGYLLFKPVANKQEATNFANIQPPAASYDKVRVRADSGARHPVAVEKTPALAQNRVRLQNHPQKPQAVITAPQANAVIKADSVAYTASNYAFYKGKANTAEDLLKKLPGVDVDANGNVTAQGKQVTKARINGKDFTGGNMADAVKNLPADIVKNIRIIDDYGDQVAKNGKPDKVLSIKTDTTSMQKMDLNNALAGRVSGLNTHTLNEVAVRGYGNEPKKEVSASVATVTAKPLDSTTLALSSRLLKAKTENAKADSTMYLAEVVVPGYSDKTKSPVRPADGWKSYLAYIKQQAVMPDNSVGMVMLAFKVGKDGLVHGIRILKGSTISINRKAIEILKNGPAWIGGSSKEIRLKIKFHKDN
ncbi:hypothetical protein BEL04_05650 [Mucilaginibacter sp. PPCGB 2223]|uniref:hypothetical protein n=1 Tax=Mucilaginibacter sp. PPCGB 2223 TaxID=1886027 RepID=UPI000824308B|nr:hypothetical protein [Mucilaginibacter sp. PPCGB 2223]OCX53771.1 hypothetical protein BEL04_05650 [Mucilaginibacter sp. PPCGB 2223]